jgi:hypothetical protein
VYTGNKVRVFADRLLRVFAIVVLAASTSFAAGTVRQANFAVNGANETLVAESATPEPGSGLLLLAGVVLLGSAAIGRKIRRNSDPTGQIKEP